MRARRWRQWQQSRGLRERQAGYIVMSSIVLSVGLGFCSVEAQMGDTQVGAFVEALRLAAPQASADRDGLYSEWQVKPANIPRWSKRCTGKELTPTEFANHVDAARSILVCVMRGVLQEQYQAAQGDVDLTVRRAASWWITGDPKRYDDVAITSYTTKVLNFYHKQTLKP